MGGDTGWSQYNELSSLVSNLSTSQSKMEKAYPFGPVLANLPFLATAECATVLPRGLAIIELSSIINKKY